LIWEVKTTDGGLRDSQKIYTNYDEISPKCDDNDWGGAGTCKDFGWTGKLGDYTNTDGFVKEVNKQGLCGAKDWRLPTRDELIDLVYCSDGKYTNLGKVDYMCTSNSIGVTTELPTINKTYFPDITEYYWFWSSSTHAYKSSYTAFIVNFGNGNSGYNTKFDFLNVRLVR
jgi:hypothetical protein